MISNPTVKDVQNLEYNEHVFITIDSLNCGVHFEGRPSAEVIGSWFLGKTLEAKRTGSHSLQPIVRKNGRNANIYAGNISHIYTQDEDQEMFV